MLLVSSCSCLCPIHWSQVLSWQWRCSWSSADRRCSNYIWVINNFSAYKGASYIRDFTVFVYQACPPCSIMKDPGVSAECYLIMLETAGISHQPSATAVLTWLELRLVLEWYLFEKYNIQHIWWGKLRADRRFALSQWEFRLTWHDTSIWNLPRMRTRTRTLDYKVYGYWQHHRYMHIYTIINWLVLEQDNLIVKSTCIKIWTLFWHW